MPNAVSRTARAAAPLATLALASTLLGQTGPRISPGVLVDGTDIHRSDNSIDARNCEDRDRGVGVTPVLLLDQFSPSSAVAAVPSQVFPDDPLLDTLLFDELSTTRPFALDQLVLFGVDEGDPSCNQQVVGQIWDGRPGDGGNIVLQAFGNQVGTDLVVNFGGQLLPPGDYLVNAHVIRPFDDGNCFGGQWFALTLPLASPLECGLWQPNLGDPITKASDLLPDVPALDAQLQLSAFLADFQDCNGNGIDDYLDINVDFTSFDTNGNGIPDECERDGLAGLTPDFDLDGIPDLDDAQPTIHTTDPGAPTAQIQLEQLTLHGTNMWDPLPRSDHGRLTLTLPTEPDVHLYVNVEIDGMWAVQNQVIYTSELPTEVPTQSETFYISLGNIPGTPVTGATVRLWVDPIGLPVLPPGPGQPVPVTETLYRIGGGGPENAGTTDAVGPALNRADPQPEPDEVKTTVENDGIRVADMKYWYTGNSCGPNSVAGSFEWLLKTYKLTLPPEVDSLEELLSKFRVLMGTLNNNWTTDAKMKEVKEGFIRKHKLPLTVESKNVGNATLGERVDGLITPQDILDELEKGQDVEILFGWWKQNGPGGTWKRNGGHFVAIKKIVKCVKDGMTTWKITFVHDSKQSACEGVECVTVTASPESIDLDNGGVPEDTWVLETGPLDAAGYKPVIESYVAESPTTGAILDAIGKCGSDYDAAYAAAQGDGTIDLEEAKELLKMTDARKKLWQRLLKLEESKDSPDQSIINSARRAIQSVCNMKERYERLVKDLSGGSRSVLPAGDVAVIEYENASVRTVDYPAALAALAPDADLDDVPDGTDNAPNDANPDQADDDMNGTPDVLELSPATDCNDNGTIDSYEVTIVDIIAMNPDGTMVAGFIFDQDGNGIPDDCEAPTPNECVADLNGDGVVDIFDFGIFGPNFGSAVLRGTGGDFDYDGDVDVFDFSTFATDFGCTP